LLGTRGKTGPQKWEIREVKSGKKLATRAVTWKNFASAREKFGNFLRAGFHHFIEVPYGVPKKAECPGPHENFWNRARKSGKKFSRISGKILELAEIFWQFCKFWNFFKNFENF